MTPLKIIGEALLKYRLLLFVLYCRKRVLKVFADVCTVRG